MNEAAKVEEFPPKRVSAKTLAKQYDMTEAAFRRYARLGIIPSVKIGKLTRFDPVEVEKALVSIGRA